VARVCVVIVTYNSEPWIRRNLESLCNSKVSADIIVVDNASSDSTLQIIRNEFSSVELIASPTNNGFGIGNNIGIARAIERSSEYTFLLNQDAYVTPDTIGEILEFMDHHPEFGSASPLHCSPDVEHIDMKTYRGYLRTYASDALCDAVLGRLKPYYRVHGVNAAAWFVRTSVFMTTGGFDPIFFMYGEDDDLLARFALHNIPFALVTNSRVVHLRETASTPGAKNFWRDINRSAAKARSSLIASVKNPNFSLIHFASTLISYGLIRPVGDFFVERNLRDFLANFIGFCRLLGEIPRVRRHARLSATVAPHFLPLAQSPETSN
jgi:GT2 family glycosyltransferase